MLPWIDALRGLAIAMVLANHVALVVPGLSAPIEAMARFGQMGVQLFFVASAYTLCLSWQQRSRCEPMPVLGFALRRFFRIAPLYYVGIALFATLHFSQPGLAVAAPYTPGPVLANLLFVHGCLPDAQNSIVPGGWSIGAEAVFYAAFPVLMLVQSRMPDGSWPWALAVAATALSLAIAWMHPGPITNNSFAYFAPWTQAPVFLVGMALFRLHGARTAARSGGPRSAVFGLLALGLTAWLWRSGMALSFVLVPVVAGLAFAALADTARGASWTPRLLQALGTRSYAIYIVHLVFVWHGLGAIDDRLALQGDAAYLAALAATTWASWWAAGLLGRWIEQPSIAWGQRLLRRLHARSPVDHRSHPERLA